MSVVYSDSASAKIAALLKQKSTTASLMSAIGKGDNAKTEAAIRSIQYQLDLMMQLFEAIVAVGDRIQVTDGAGKPVAIIGQLDGNVFGIHATEAYFGGTLGDVSTAEVSVVNGSATFTGTVSAAAFNVYVPLIDALTLTDNSPAAGRIAWGACSLYFAGTTYSIASGNTSSSTHKHVYWVRGASTFTSAVEMPEDVDNYLIATNNGGTADISIGKVGSAKSVTEGQLVFSLLKGIAIQPEATNTPDLTAIETRTILSVASGGGVLIGLYFLVTANVAGTPTTVLKIQVDGETEQTLTLYTAANTASEGFNARANGGRSGNMSTAGDYRNCILGMSFSDSVSVKVQTTSAASPTGTLGVYAVYGLKTAA